MCTCFKVETCLNSHLTHAITLSHPKCVQEDGDQDEELDEGWAPVRKKCALGSVHCRPP